MSLSQGQLSISLGVTFQQIQKYERGTNRVSASRLYDIAKILSTPISFFFEDMEEYVANQSPRLRAGLKENSSETIYETDPMERIETIDLARNYYKIKSLKSRKLVRDLIESLAKGNLHPDEEEILEEESLEEDTSYE